MTFFYAKGSQRTIVTDKMRQIGLQDRLSQHPAHLTVNSFFRGTDIIDGIYLSRTLVQLGGRYHSFAESPGDHRGIQIDICAEAALGNKIPIALPRQPRRLQIKIPTTVRKFNELFYQHICKHKLAKRASRLRENAKNPLTEKQMEEYESIDAEMVQGMKTSVRKKCAFRPNALHFS